MEAVQEEKKAAKAMKYYAPEHETTEDAREFKSAEYEHCSTVAEDAAEDFFYRHSGWESSWPLTIALVDEDGESRWEVERHMRPEFDARRLKA